MEDVDSAHLRSADRRTGVDRTPNVVVLVSSQRSQKFVFSWRHRMYSVVPTLPFFICVDTIHASAAPSSRARSRTAAICSAVMSSMLQQTSESIFTSTSVDVTSPSAASV
eukprot:scaffold7358_cov252-Pinguiococcus_pyrenoidosus.AAC.29